MIDGLIEYCQSVDYIHNVLAGVTVLFVEVILVVIAIPLCLSLINRINSRGIRATVDFYLFQIFNKITKMFLDMLSIDNTQDIMSILFTEMNANNNFRILNHYIYGPLDNILFILNKRIKDSDTLHTELLKKATNDFENYYNISKNCLDEIDKLIMLVASMPTVQQDLFQIRIFVYVLRDMTSLALADMKDDSKNKDSLHLFYDLEKCISDIVKCIDTVFSKRRKLIDSRLKHQEQFRKALLVCTLVRLAILECKKKILKIFRIQP